jgi:putative endonuclease
MSYYVYITTNPGKKVLYTGVTNNLKRRLKEHRDEKGIIKHFTGRYFCHKLIYYEEFKYINDAIAREKEIKKMNREEKVDLIKEKNPNWHTIIIW